MKRVWTISLRQRSGETYACDLNANRKRVATVPMKGDENPPAAFLAMIDLQPALSEQEGK